MHSLGFQPESVIAKPWIWGPSWAQLCLTHSLWPRVARNAAQHKIVNSFKCFRFFLLTISFWSLNFTGASMNFADGSPVAMSAGHVAGERGRCQACAMHSGTSYLRVAGTRLAA